MSKIKGFNDKEQRTFDRMRDGEPHDFAELKTLFWEDARAHCRKTYRVGWGKAEIDAQAQSFARNSIRRLIRDGWVEQSGRGTYHLSRTGKIRIGKGTNITPSASKIKETKGLPSKKVDSKKVKVLKDKVTKEAKKEKIVDKAKKTAAKADKESGHKTKVKQMTEKAAVEQTIEEKLASMCNRVMYS